MGANTRKSGPSGGTISVWSRLRLSVAGTSAGKFVLDRLHALAFWSAVVLPWGLLAALFLGLPSQYPGSFTALLTANFLCVVTGYRYGTSRRQSRPER